MSDSLGRSVLDQFRPLSLPEVLKPVEDLPSEVLSSAGDSGKPGIINLLNVVTHAVLLSEHIHHAATPFIY